MKTLILLRHGKAEAYHAEGDHERVLAPRGIRDAGSAGRWIAGEIGIPDTIVSSDAARARQTAALAAEAMGCHVEEIVLEPRIYQAGVGDLLEVIHGLSDGAKSVLMVGHNPGFEELAHALGAHAPSFGPMPTAAAAALRFDTDSWANVAEGGGKHVGYFAPHS